MPESIYDLLTGHLTLPKTIHRKITGAIFILYKITAMTESNLQTNTGRTRFLLKRSRFYLKCIFHQNGKYQKKKKTKKPHQTISRRYSKL